MSQPGRQPWAVVGEGALLADRYRLDRPIGAGGMGRVWAAWDTVLNRDVAVKLHQLDPAAGRADLERFLREARATAALQHPNVVTVYDSGTDRDQAFLVMELLPGPTLQAYVNEHDPLPEPEAVALGLQIAAGVAAAHGAGVVHRDIKPSNVMFDATGRLKIVDFGIARLTQTTATGLTITNAVIGSPPYLSPEQFQGSPADERSDLYALGCVLTTLLTGRPPFQGEHPLAYGHQHVYVPAPPIRERRPDVSPGLEALIERLLMKDPRERPGSALEVLRELAVEEPSPAATPSEPTTAPLPLSGGRARHRRTAARWVFAAVLTPAVTAIALAAGTTTTDRSAATVAAAGQPTVGSHQQDRQSAANQHQTTRAGRAGVRTTSPAMRSDTDTGHLSGTAGNDQAGAAPNATRGRAKKHGAKEAAPGQQQAGPNRTGEKNKGSKISGATKDRPDKAGPGRKQPKTPHKAPGPKTDGHKTTPGSD